MIAFFNENIGNILMLVVADNKGAKLGYERKANITRVFLEDTGETVAWNFFGEEFDRNGEIKLSEKQIWKLEDDLAAAGFSETLEGEVASNFRVAEIVEMEDHPDSDHLHICQVDVGADSLVQIVCGAANARVGLKTVAALPISLMPNGALIFDGALRGVKSHGMLCSARELGVKDAVGRPGIIELTGDFQVGDSFEAEKN